MKVAVIYESFYGNTKEVAEAIALPYAERKWPRIARGHFRFVAPNYATRRRAVRVGGARN